VLAAGSAFDTKITVCVPGFTLLFKNRGITLLKWIAPTYSGCLAKHSFGNYRICLSSLRSPAGASIHGDLVGLCDHPVFPVNTVVDAILTKEDGTSLRSAVGSVGSIDIVLTPRSGAGSEQ
jgi:hypothetical protein